MGESVKMNYIVVQEPFEMTIDVMKPHWALLEYDLKGDSIVVSRGMLRIEHKYLIDLMDRKRGITLPDGEMLHFIIEHFGDDLEKGILRQSILIGIACNKISHRIKGKRILRWGDDIFDEDRRITLTSATITLVSSKIHLGICIRSDENTGFVGTEELGIDADELGEVICNQYMADMKRLAEKCWRMRPI